MKKVLISIFCFLIIFTIFFQIFPQFAYATNPNFDTGVYDPGNDHSGTPGNTVAKIVGTALTFVQIVAAGISVVMLITLGVKYMTGSVEAKADVKNNTVTYAIGAGIAFGATAIATIVKQFVLKNLG